MIKVKPDAHTTIFIGADSGIRTHTVQILSLLPPTYCAMPACANLIPIGRSHDCLPCILGLQASLCSWLWPIDRAPHYLPGQTRRIVSNSWVYSTTCGHTILSHSAPSMLDPVGLKTAVYPFDLVQPTGIEPVSTVAYLVPTLGFEPSPRALQAHASTRLA